MLGAMRGVRGRPGEKGAPGVHIVKLDVIGFCLVVWLSDGQTLHANFEPMLQYFRRETS